MPDATAAITLTDVLAYVSLGASMLVAGRVVFSTEAAVKALEKADVTHESQLNALLTSSGEAKATHAALVERVNAISVSMESKASVESVLAVREAVESLRREQDIANRAVLSHLERIEAKMHKNS